MKNLRNYSACFILLLLGACSTDPIETGPFQKDYKCDLNGHYYSDKTTYDYYCNEEKLELVRREDSILKIWLTEPRIEKKCMIDNARLESEYRCKTESLNVWILFDSVTYRHRKFRNNDSFFVEVNHGEKEYKCHDLLPAGVDSVFTDSTCSDTLGIQAIIDVFANFPDSLCEELPKD